jgi:hypothetical protein
MVDRAQLARIQEVESGSAQLASPFRWPFGTNRGTRAALAATLLPKETGC